MMMANPAQTFLSRIFPADVPAESGMFDGTSKVAWRNLAEPIATITSFLRARGIGPTDPVIVECVNSVPGATTVLALLASGTTFALFPAPKPGAVEPPLPKFFRHRIRVRSVLGSGQGDGISLAHPETFLDIHPLDEHNPLPMYSPLRRERLLLRTSGSIDAPKMVVHTHASLLANARNAVERLALEGTDRVLIPVPLAHMYGLGAGFLPSLCVGASIELLEGANVLRYFDRERIFRPTVAFLTPNLCTMFVRPRTAPEHFRHVVVAGDKLHPDMFHKAEALYRRVVNLYGSSELGVICAADARETEGARDTTVGRPLPGVELRLSKQSGSADRYRDSGELLCSHPYGFECYVDNDGECIMPDDPTLQEGWVSTRDIARVHPDGLVEVLGRSDHAVKRDGRLVMLAEVERAIERLPGVEKAAAIVAGETNRGRGIVVCCALREGANVDSDALRRACHDILPIYAIPDEIRTLAALPTLPSGKLDRRALQQTLADTSTVSR